MAIEALDDHAQARRRHAGLMPGGPDDHARRDQRELKRDSDRLLKAIGELRDLEQQKRREPISSPPFQDLAKRVEDKAREVYRLADEEADDAAGSAREAPPDSDADDDPQPG
jgi:hypothetical protein